MAERRGNPYQIALVLFNMPESSIPTVPIDTALGTVLGVAVVAGPLMLIIWWVNTLRLMDSYKKFITFTTDRTILKLNTQR